MKFTLFLHQQNIPAKALKQQNDFSPTPLELMSRYRDPQIQAIEITSILFRPNICKS